LGDATDIATGNRRRLVVKTIAVVLTLAISGIAVSAAYTEAYANRMNGKGNCAGGVCTGGGTTWNPSGAKRYKTTKIKK
jgi:hypothetical protein